MKIEANVPSSPPLTSSRRQTFASGPEGARLGLVVATVGTKFHRAAVDGYVDMLCEASKKETNLASEHTGLTPTLLAAQHGHLEALRILVGRGGDPERTSLDGSSALHLAAARNHLNCVSFLVNFGVNMWALDNELHTAKDIAAIEQRKEVLDYLDQMMAKQSALNTKNVQKLKEKAKVATEKRLKQMRKAQLKAIKQVEKDERYLVKLSNNRRLLKAAHSISDIKLVGRSSEISFTPSDRSQASSVYSSELGTSPSLSSSSGQIASSGGRLSNSNSLANFLRSQKLLSHHHPNNNHHHLPSSEPSAASQSSARHHLLANFRPSLKLSMGISSDESAYGSSLSSTSGAGYLSSSSVGIAGALYGAKSLGATPPNGSSGAHLAGRRPKYSDLVAVHSDESAMRKMRATNNTQRQPGKAASKGNSKQGNANELQSLKSSNSTIGTRLKGISSGVSRKVQLKRLLLAGASQPSSGSGADLSSEGSSSTGQQQVGNGTGSQMQTGGHKEVAQEASDSGGCPSKGMNKENISTAHSNHGNPGQDSSARLEAPQPNGKLCNVHPVMKLKLNNAVDLTGQSNGQQQLANSNNICEPSGSGGSIKWPPAPVMGRAVSEPDFGLALRLASVADDDDGGGDDDEENDELSDENNYVAQDFERRRSSESEAVNCLQQAPITADKLQCGACESEHLNGTNAIAELQGGSGIKGAVRTEQQQHHLLTQCLSQLKLRHESITKQQQDSVAAHAASECAPNKVTQIATMAAQRANLKQQVASCVSATRQTRASQAVIFENSNELIQHQLNAGEFPLRPSVIKQHLSASQQQSVASNNVATNNQRSPMTAKSNPSMFQFVENSAPPKSQAPASANSIDSIGSAGSLAKRNSQSSPSKSSTNSSLFYSSSSSSSSSYSSSIEAPASEKQKIRQSGKQVVNQAAIGKIQASSNSSNSGASGAAPAPTSHSCRQQQACMSKQETIATFLLANGLLDLGEIFAREKIDLEALMLLNDEDLKSLNILLGPRRKLLKAIETRRLSKPQRAAGPMYVMVDTAL